MIYRDSFFRWASHFQNLKFTRPFLPESASLLTTEVSSTCLEALACGIPVIMIENENGLTYDPVPKNIHGEMVRKTRSLIQLKNVF